jgi:hypothetical protein
MAVLPHRKVWKIGENPAAAAAVVEPVYDSKSGETMSSTGQLDGAVEHAVRRATPAVA